MMFGRVLIAALVHTACGAKPTRIESAATPPPQPTATSIKTKTTAEPVGTNPPVESLLDLTDRCAMVEATFRLDAVKRFCGGASTDRGRILVDVRITPPFTSTETCSSKVFAIYREGQATNTNALLRLQIGRVDAHTWGFSPTTVDPPNSPNDKPRADGGMEDVDYYCGLIGGRLAGSHGSWRAWIEE